MSSALKALSLSYPQHVFLNELNTKFRGYIGGFGSGKSFAGCLDLGLFAGRHPRTVQGYFGPTYRSISDIFYPTFEEAAHLLGFRTHVRVSADEVDLYRGRVYYGTIICRSMDNPTSIVGFKISRALVDEIDILNPAKARLAWRKIIARLRLTIEGVVNSIGVTTTPEGFRFAYSLFADRPTVSYSMVQASSYENERFLPDDYIPSLLETYSPELVQAYVNGQFVNLTTGTVYRNFSRTLNASTAHPEPGEVLHIGMDFNVGQMAARVHIIRNGDPIAVGEISEVLDTPAMIDEIKRRYRPAHLNIKIYPDSSGDNRDTTNADETDISLLQAAGFHVIYNPANPPVRNRINAMNSMFCNAEGRRRYMVNVGLCPRFVKDLEQQAWDDKGKPDKTTGADHGNDAAGYFIAHMFPVIRPVVNVGARWG